jgi:carboxypeptidase Taq
MRPQSAYDELIRRSREQALLASCAALLSWDEETYMPRGGAANRAEQLAHLAGLEHERATDARLGELLTVVEGSSLVRDPSSAAGVNVRELRRRYNRLTRLPRKLVEDLARVTTRAQQEWALARKDADFKRFRPWLDRVLNLKRDEGQALGDGRGAYDALLDDYEPGASAAELARLFAALGEELAPLAARLAGAPRRPNVSVLRREYPIERQSVFGEMVAAALGFDFERGRLDPTTHPFFSSIGPGDCRITTRYSRHNFSDAFFSTLHEVGHGLYEQGLDPEQQGTPLGESPSLGLHESQARLWENTIGRSRPFWEHFYPLARQVFREALSDVGLDDFHFAVNQVGASLIRVQADEVTYDLHILIRFELEQALLSSDLRPAELPSAWAEAYRRRLGVVPENHSDGCLQDGHWAAGLVGYFPTYTLGNVYAAQLFAAAEAERGDPGPAFARGDFGGLLDWLRSKVYRAGSRFSATELVQRVTGQPPDPRPLAAALRRKYETLYGVE